jgi:DUF4097 and DUF4098 domain-containing protein YvlB
MGDRGMSEWKIDSAETIQFDETPTDLHVSMVAGEVELAAGEGPAFLEVRQVSGPELRVRLANGRLEIEQEREHLSWGVNKVSASLTLQVPADCQVELEAVSASVFASGFSEDVRLETVSGEITLESLTGRTRATTVSGELNARGQVGELRGETVSGDVTLDAYSAHSVRLQSVSGEVAADLQQAGSDASAELETVSGAVYLRLASEPSQEVRVDSVSGRLVSSFPQLTAKSSPGSRTLKGTLGGGQGKVRVTTVSGAVSLLAEASA